MKTLELEFTNDEDTVKVMRWIRTKFPSVTSGTGIL